MEKAANILLVLVLTAGFLFTSCSVSREQEVEHDFNNFREWVDTKATQLGNLTEEDWKKAKEDFQVRTRALDRRQDQFTDRIKEEYKQLKNRFGELDAEYNEQRAVANWRRELLGEYANLSKINSANVVAAYTRFMESVRERHKDWSEQVWDLTDEVFEQLNTRKEALNGAVATEDDVKIKALQMEYSTLEAATP
ncbi:hypothetical protein [Botryobacter ruber]|uniref:hypothetical protein n=1 Tax=Botryobacter ruber TaxID=2171629 RepID=UPI000E0C5F5F|nr:hypothetical protein [Botryobacter ruber]